MHRSRRLDFMVFWVTTIVGCQPNQAAERVVAPFRCTAARVAEVLDPQPAVTLITDTAPAMRAWRDAVGGPVLDRAGRVCEHAPLDSLLVVSWNTHLGHADIQRFVSDLRGGRVIAGARVQHFVLLLQEAFRESEAVPARRVEEGCTRRLGGAGHDIEEVADSLGLALFYVASMRNGCDAQLRQDRGNAILSTLPLSNLKAVELPLVRQRRVAVMGEVKGYSTTGHEWTLAIASVHLENRGRGTPRDWMFGRAQQARTFAAHLPDSVLLAVGGDFNALRGSSEPALRIVGARFANSPPHQKEHTFVGYVIMRSQLDYLFFRGIGKQSSYWRARDRYGSDHYPIMGFVRVG